jgi:hypothetical protein
MVVALPLTSKLDNLRLRRTDHPLAELSDQLIKRLVWVNLQESRVSTKEVEHARLLLRMDNERLHRDRGQVGHDPH